VRRSDGMRNILDSMAVDEAKRIRNVYRLKGQTVVSKNGACPAHQHMTTRIDPPTSSQETLSGV
jgi:hypothetical protein